MSIICSWHKQPLLCMMPGLLLPAGDTQPPPDAVEDPGEGPNLDDVESYVFDFNMDEYNPVVQLLLGSIGDPGEVMQAFRGGRRRQTLSQVMCKADKENFQM